MTQVSAICLDKSVEFLTVDGVPIPILLPREQDSIHRLQHFMKLTEMTSWTPPETLSGRPVAVIGAGVLGRRIGIRRL